MVTPQAIAMEKERLYESSSLRDDLNDREATLLLLWGETQVDRLTQEFPEEFEQKARFLRQLLKNINRFVGQREFNEMDGQKKYIGKIVKYLDTLGWSDIRQETFFEALPDDKADMKANLDAILSVLTPAEEESSDSDEPTEPTESKSTVGSQADASSSLGATLSTSQSDISVPSTKTALIDDSQADIPPSSEATPIDAPIDENMFEELENSNEHSINQPNTLYDSGEIEYGEE